MKAFGKINGKKLKGLVAMGLLAEHVVDLVSFGNLTGDEIKEELTMALGSSMTAEQYYEEAMHCSMGNYGNAKDVIDISKIKEDTKKCPICGTKTWHSAYFCKNLKCDYEFFGDENG